jgi:hypothetical protein
MAISPVDMKRRTDLSAETGSASSFFRYQLHGAIDEYGDLPLCFENGYEQLLKAGLSHMHTCPGPRGWMAGHIPMPGTAMAIYGGEECWRAIAGTTSFMLAAGSDFMSTLGSVWDRCRDLFECVDFVQAR